MFNVTWKSRLFDNYQLPSSKRETLQSRVKKLIRCIRGLQSTVEASGSIKDRGTLAQRVNCERVTFLWSDAWYDLGKAFYSFSNEVDIYNSPDKPTLDSVSAKGVYAE